MANSFMTISLSVLDSLDSCWMMKSSGINCVFKMTLLMSAMLVYYCSARGMSPLLSHSLAIQFLSKWLNKLSENMFSACLISMFKLSSNSLVCMCASSGLSSFKAEMRKAVHSFNRFLDTQYWAVFCTLILDGLGLEPSLPASVRANLSDSLGFTFMALMIIVSQSILVSLVLLATSTNLVQFCSITKVSTILPTLPDFFQICCANC